jgi:hypothetical protein
MEELCTVLSAKGGHDSLFGRLSFFFVSEMVCLDKIPILTNQRDVRQTVGRYCSADRGYAYLPDQNVNWVQPSAPVARIRAEGFV